jgi:hypothetical protein
MAALRIFGRPFTQRLITLAEAGHWEPEWALAIFAYESGFDPSIRNAIGAAGLNQFMPDTLRDMGWDERVRGRFNEQPAIVQLEYTARSWDWWRKTLKIPRWEHRAHLYQATFWPASAAGEFSLNEVMLDATKSLKMRIAVAANRNLDVTTLLPDGTVVPGPDNKITVGELELGIQRGIASHRDRYDAEVAILRTLRGQTPDVMPAESWRAVQQALAARGWYSGVIDGIAGRETLAAMTETLGRSVFTWHDVQRELSRRGFYAGQIDGSPGPLTRRAVAALLSETKGS